jgi:formate dehydrogenase iron-sulfur subunit
MNAILVDVTKCVGCERCVAACVDANERDPNRAQVDRASTTDGLSASRPLSLIQIAEGRFARKSCMHCVDPSCVSACLVGGLTKTADGPVVYDPAKCIGCRYCMLACPFHVPRYEWTETAPLMVKCDLCAQRTAQGVEPACVEACPHEALTFGPRDALVEEAHDRIARGPSAYLPRVWGEDEFGGTSVLYVSDVDLGALGWPDGDAAAIPSLTESLITKTPFIGGGVACSLLAINWMIGRRMKLAAEAEPRAGDARADSLERSEP